MRLAKQWPESYLNFDDGCVLQRPTQGAFFSLDKQNGNGHMSKSNALE